MKESSFRTKFDDAAGIVCKALIPIKQEYYLGKGDKIAICTLSSLHLLQEISITTSIMERIILAGRLLSENKGIDNIIDFAYHQLTLESIIVCGKEVKGHRAGQALLSVHNNGIDVDGRIIGALGPNPFLNSSAERIEAFRKRVKIVDLIGVTDIRRIRELLVI